MYRQNKIVFSYHVNKDAAEVEKNLQPEIEIIKQTMDKGYGML